MEDLEYFTKLNQSEEQQKLLSAVSESRGYADNDILNAYRAVFVLSFEHMNSLFSHLSIYEMMFTSTGITFVPGRVLIPGFSPQGHLITYATYDAVTRMKAKETGSYDTAYYFYPEESKGFKKSNFLLMPFESWGEAIRTRKIAVADGIFDAGAVSVCGIPCGANLGTAVGTGVKEILSLFDEVTHFKDNDEAGTQMYMNLASFVKNLNVVDISHLLGKDIDGAIVELGRDGFKKFISENGRISLNRRRMGKRFIP